MPFVDTSGLRVIERLPDGTTGNTSSRTIKVNAHVDIGNPNDGLLGMITHGLVDGLGGHIVDFLFKKNRSIDVDCTK